MAQNDSKWTAPMILAVVNLGLILVGGGIAYGNVVSAIGALTEMDARLEAADGQIRLDANAHEARLRVVEQSAGRMDEKLQNIADGIERLSAQIDRLVDQEP